MGELYECPADPYPEFNEIQTDKRNTYRKKVAADKALGAKSGSPTAPGEGNGIVEGHVDGEPVAKKARLDTEGGMTEPEDAELLDEGDLGDEVTEEVDEEGDVDEIDDEEGEGEGEGEGEEGDENEVMEEALEEQEGKDEGDEALDNGEDSD